MNNLHELLMETHGNWSDGLMETEVQFSGSSNPAIMGLIKRKLVLFATLGFFDPFLQLVLASYGFQDFGTNFNFHQYDLRRSCLELWLLSLLRCALIIGSICGIWRNVIDGSKRMSRISLIVVTLATTIMSYSPFKLLCLAEIPGWSPKTLSLWIWFLLAWNIIGSGVLLVSWLSLAGLAPKAEEAAKSKKDDEESLIPNGTATSEEGGNKKKPKVELKQSLGLLKRLLSYCKVAWELYLAGFFFLFIYSLARVFIPYYTAQVIAEIVITQSPTQLVHSVLVMIGLAFASAIFGGLRGGCFMYAIAKVSRRIRGSLFQSLTEQEIGFYDTTKTGEVTSRLTADCQTMSDTVGLNVNVMMRNLVMLIGSLIMMFKISWEMTMISFIAIPLIGVVSKVYGAYYDKLSKETQDSLATANEVAEEVLSSMRTVRSFANESGESDRYWLRLDDVLRIAFKKTLAYVGYVWTNELFDLLLLAAVLWYGGHLVITNRLEKGDMISFLLYQLQLGENLMGIGAVYTGLMQSVGASRKVFDYIDRVPEISNSGTRKGVTLKGRIRFDKVKFSYPSRPEAQVLKEMSFTVEAGETVALVGPSGGGKSSCISLLEHFYEPLSGRILVDGIPVQDYDHKYYHQRVSLVSQEPVLFAKSIAENIRYGMEKELEGDWEEKVMEAGKMANAHDFVSALPDAYKTEVGEKGVQLSGGQKQRVAIARALLRAPNVLLLDEATSALDAESEHLVQQAIYKNLGGRTVVLIAHRLSTVEKADRILVVNDGQIIQTGTHISLLQEDGIYRNLVQRQLLGVGSGIDELGRTKPDRKSAEPADIVSPVPSSYKSPSLLSSSPSSSP